MSAKRVLMTVAVLVSPLPMAAQGVVQTSVTLASANSVVTVSPEWTSAVEVLRSALLIDDRVPERWYAYGRALYHTANYRDAIGAFERAMQLRAGASGDIAWHVARSYAQLGDGKQALRWAELSVLSGVSTREAIRTEPLFQRWKTDARFRRLVGLNVIPGEARSAKSRNPFKLKSRHCV